MVRPFGSCCDELKTSMNTPQASCFRVESNGVLYLSVGYASTSEGISWYDQAVLYCPFCGAHLQDPSTIDASRRL